MQAWNADFTYHHAFLIRNEKLQRLVEIHLQGKLIRNLLRSFERFLIITAFKRDRSHRYLQALEAVLVGSDLT